jgi:outer membrane immunogenic protein
MKKKLLALVLIASSTGVFAQAKNFEGFTAGVNVSSVGGTSTLSGDGSSIDFGQQSFVPTVELGYNFAATNDIVLGLTATYDFADTKLGQAGDPELGDLNFKGQNRMSINFKPGYVVSPNTMVYATVGYNSMKTVASFDGASLSKNLNGIGYGLGISVMVNKNIFVKGEVQQINFDSWSQDGISAKPNLTVGTIGVGYRF